MIFKSLLIILFIQSLYSLKRSQAGSHDWHIKTVGQIDSAVFLKKDRIAVLNKAGDLSYLNKTSGDVILKTKLGNLQTIFRKQTQGFSPQFYYLPEGGSTWKISFEDDQQKNVSPISEKVVEVIYHGSASIVVTPNSVTLQNKEASTISAKNGQFISAFELENKNIIVVETGSNKLCTRTIEVSSTLSEQSNKCIDIPNTQVYSLNKYSVLVKNNIVSVLDSITLKQTLKTQGQLYKLLPKSSSVLVRSNGQLKKLNLKNQVISQFSLAGTIGQTSKGAIFSIEKSGDTFFLQQGSAGRLSWLSNSSAVTSAWINQINQLQSQLLVQYSDLRVEYFTFEVLGTKDRMTYKWSRQQALSDIENILFLDFQNEKELSNPYYETLLHHHSSTSVISLYISRLSFQVQALISGIKLLISDIFTTISNINISQLLKGESSFLSSRSESDEKYFGMRKIVLVSSTNGIIFALDSKTSAILWKSSFESLSNSASTLKLFRMIGDQTQKVIVSIYQESKDTITLFNLNWNNGVSSKLKEFKVVGQPQVFQVGEDELGIKDSKKVQYYNLEQQGEEEEEEFKHSFIFTNFNQTHINCQSILPTKNVFNLWNMVIPADEQLLKVTQSFRNDLQSKLPLFKDNIVYLKNVDYTNFAVITRIKNSNVLNLYVLNGQNGHILLNKFKRNVDFNQQINVVYDQNTILVSYFNTLNKMFEIWTIEQYKDKTYTSVSEIIQQYFTGLNSGDLDHSHQKIRNNIMVFENVFGSPLTIKSMFVSTSKHSLIRRNIYIITQKNQIYPLDRRLINTRRPSSQSPLQNQKYLPYDYLIPINPTQFVTYSLNLNLNKIQFSPTSLESTFLLLAVGEDLFMTRCSPDGTFDMITDSFSYTMLISVVVLVTVILQFLKRKVKKARIAKQFIN